LFRAALFTTLAFSQCNALRSTPNQCGWLIAQPAKVATMESTLHSHVEFQMAQLTSAPMSMNKPPDESNGSTIA